MSDNELVNIRVSRSTLSEFEAEGKKYTLGHGAPSASIAKPDTGKSAFSRVVARISKQFGFNKDPSVSPLPRAASQHSALSDVHVVSHDDGTGKCTSDVNAYVAALNEQISPTALAKAIEVLKRELGTAHEEQIMNAGAKALAMLDSRIDIKIEAAVQDVGRATTRVHKAAADAKKATKDAPTRPP